MKTFRLILLLSGLNLFLTGAYGQKTQYYFDVEKEVQLAKELFTQKKYNAAFHQFEIVQSKAGRQSELYSEAEYFKALSALKSNQSAGDRMMTQFLDSYSESPYVNQARFNLGGYQFDSKRYPAALRYLSQVDRAELSPDEQILLHYQMGYSYMNQEDLDKAAAEFYQIKDKNNLFSRPANYYWAHINYLKGNYEAALDGFSKLNGDPTYSKVIPLYVSHIFYKQEKYEEIVNYTPLVLEDVEESHKAELAKITGDSYFHLKEFEKAIPYLEIYQASKGPKSREDNYLSGYCYYFAGQYAKAIPYLENASKGKDELAQNAYYHLADCYVRNDDKKKARVAFEAASEFDFDEKIKEDALFNYAKITYELSYSPFSETIKAFDKYISLYPNSDRNSMAYQYLVEVYMVTRNYKDAINSIEKIKVRNASINKAYQRVTFYRGLELFNNQEYNPAIAMFDKSLANADADRNLKARALYWKAEALYRVGDYNSAISEYNKFLLAPGAFSLPEYADAQYNIAYAYYKLEDYQAATSFFRKYLNSQQNQRTEKVADAYNRAGDGYFLTRDYEEAIKNYKQAYNLKLYDPDYSLFRIAFCEGLQKQNTEKIAHLRNLLNDYPKSGYRDDALFELGRAYERSNQNPDAIKCYNDIVSNYQQSPLYPKALLQLGLISFNNGNLNESLKYYKEVAEKFPNTEESESALAGIKNAYVEQNNVDAYFAYTQQLGRGTVSASEQDALVYQSAEKQFMSGDKNAIPQLKKYINDFPYGAYMLNARFYLAEALYKSGQYSEALGHYDYVASQPDNIFTEQAVAKTAELTLNAGNYSQALPLFIRLEALSGTAWNTLKAQSGKMKCYFELQQYNEAAGAAQKVRSSDKASEVLLRDAGYILAKSYYMLENYSQALPELKKAAAETNSAQGAEAKYLVAESLYKTKQAKAAETEILDFISKGTPHQYWLGKSFILLSEIYTQSGDNFQAKHTLKSLVDNYGNTTDGIIDEASKKLADIEAREQAEQDEAKSKSVEINIDQQ